jgi:acyl-CoA synthetase (AMP-forming)/AMP-acid ligase II
MHATSSGSLKDVLRARAEETPERNAFGFWGEGRVDAWLTYGELDRRARAIAARLQSCVGHGGRALLLFPPGFDYESAFFGCLYANVIAIPAYPPEPARLDRTLPRLQAIITDAQPTVVLTTAALLAFVDPVLQLAPELGSLEWIATDGLDCEDAWIEPTVGPGDVAFVQYTSGSTGVPKGVTLTHGNLLSNSHAIQRAAGFSMETRMVAWVPPYHDMGLIGSIIQPVFTGFPCVQMSPVQFLLRPLRWLQAITHLGATASGAPNFAYDLCARKISNEQKQKLDLSTWDLAYVGAEPVRAETLERFAAAFTTCRFAPRAFYPCYGLAESTLMVTGVTKGAGYRTRLLDNGARAVGMGKLVTGGELRVVDPETQTPVPAGTVGEIWVRSTSVAVGYWNRASDSIETFGVRTRDGAGPFLRTGDLGLLEGDELFVTGRRKELIIVRGRKHFPTDIESTVEQLQFESPHYRAGGCAAFSELIGGEERLCLAVEVERRQAERRAGASPSVERRRGADRRHRPFSYKQGMESVAFQSEDVIRSIRNAVALQHGVEVQHVFLMRPGSIPKTSSGKKQRVQCRELLTGGSRRDVLHAWHAAEPTRSGNSTRIKVA